LSDAFPELHLRGVFDLADFHGEQAARLAFVRHGGKTLAGQSFDNPSPKQRRHVLFRLDRGVLRFQAAMTDGLGRAVIGHPHGDRHSVTDGGRRDAGRGIEGGGLRDPGAAA
jgi:hypothetical protein